MSAKYKFYEIVRVNSSCKHLQLQGSIGAIVGMSQDEQGQWGYAVHMYHLDRTWSLMESELDPTGKMDKRETFYDETCIKVQVDPTTGEGRELHH